MNHGVLPLGVPGLKTRRARSQITSRPYGMRFLTRPPKTYHTTELMVGFKLLRKPNTISMGILIRWLKADSVNAHRNLALMVTQEGLPRTKHPGGYWTDHHEQWTQLNDWLRRPEVRQKLRDAFEQWADSPFADELMDAAVFLPG